MTDRTCTQCGDAFTWVQSGPGRAATRCPSCRRPPRCGCDDCKSTRAESARTARARRKETGHAYRRPDYEYRDRTCDECGRRIRSNAGGARDGLTLCKEHRDAKSVRDRARSRQRTALLRTIEAAARGTRGNPRWPFFQGDCGTCGASFMRRGQPTPYCSKACNPKSAHRGWIKQSVRLAIYERDGWTCHLCSGSIDPRLDPADDMAASLDHVVPRSMTLFPDHSPENLRTAHRVCNSARGVRPLAA